MRDLTKELHKPKKSYRAMWIISLLTTALLVWSYYTTFNRVVRANGSIVSMSRTQIVQNLEGGILISLNVHEGDKIEQGQVLAQLDTTRYEAQVEEIEKKIATFKLRELRLKHEMQGKRAMDVPEDYRRLYPDLVHTETALLASKLDEYQGRKQNYAKLISLKEDELNNVMRFKNSGAIAKRELLNIEQGLANLMADRDNFLSEYHKKQATELAETVSQLAVLNETVKTTKDQLQRATVKAPSAGTVNQLFFSTIGAVVTPGQTILEIVPDEGSVLVETRVIPKDIGYVVPNMRATLKLTAYDYSIYGTLLGKVVKIGADTVPDKNHRDQPPSYVVTLEINKDSLEQWLARGLELRTGMVVEAELEAGSMKIIDYIFRPLLKTRDAMSTI